MGIWLSLISFVVSIASLTLAYWTLRNNALLTKEGFRERRETSIMEWGDRVIETLCACISLSRKGSGLFSARDFFIEKENCLRRLSALIDRGRWYFPNVDQDEYGLTKELAYRGHRQPILDHLVGAYDLVSDLEQDDPRGSEASARLDTLKRAFVAEVQSKVDVRRRVEVSELMLDQRSSVRVTLKR